MNLEWPRIIMLAVLGFVSLFIAVPKMVLAYGANYVSPIQDFYGPTYFSTSTWNITTDASSSIGVEVRTGDSLIAGDGTWTSWQHLATSTNTGANQNVQKDLATVGVGVLQGKRYLQYQVVLEIFGAEDAYVTTTSQPVLNNIDFTVKRGEFWSSIYNSQTLLNNGLNSFSWQATTPANSEIRFQLRSSIDNINWSPWCGKDNGVLGGGGAFSSCDSLSFFVASSSSPGPLDVNAGNVSYKIDLDLATTSDDIYYQYRAVLFPDPANPTLVPILGTTSLGYSWDYFFGTYTSPVLGTSTSQPFHFQNITFAASTTNNINFVEFRLRSGNSANTADGSWTSWESGVSSSTNAVQGKFAVNFSTSSLAILDGPSGHKFYQYEATLKTSDVNSFPELHDVQVNTYTYNPGWFISSWYNTQDVSAEMGSLTWRETASSTDVHPYTVSVQARTASSSATGTPMFVDTFSTDWFGPNGTTSTYFTASNTPLSCVTNQLSATTSSSYCPVGDGNYLSTGGNDQFLQYKIYLDTDGFNAPVLNEATLGYGINVAPTFINTTANSTTTGAVVRQWKEADKDKANDLATLINPNVEMTGKSLITFALYDADTLGVNAQGSSTARLPGQANLSLQYCDRADGNCALLSDWKIAATSSYGLYDASGALIHDGLNTNPGFSNSTTTIALGDASTTPAVDYHLLFDLKKEVSLQNVYLTNFHFRVVADDAEGANRYGYLDSGTSTLDTLAPAVTDFKINASTQLGAQPATFYATAVDDTASGTELLMRDSLDAGFSDNPAWRTYAATSTKFLSAATATVYAQFKDAYGNIYTGQIAPPAPPEGLMLADISNPVDESYKLFVSWKKIFDPVHFSRYVIWRATSTTICGDLFTDTACYEALNFTEHISESVYTNNFFTDANLASTTTYYYKVTMEDNDGNISRYLDVIHDNPDGQGGTDKTPPALSNAQVTATSTQSATIEWETDELSKSMVYFLPQANYETNVANSEPDLFLGAKRVGLNGFTQNNATLFGPHIVTLNKLVPNTTYYYKLTSEDPSGNVGQLLEQFDAGLGAIAPLTFQTKNGPEINSSIQAKSITNTSATISWTTTLPSNSSVIYSTSTDSINQLVAPVETKGSLTQVTEHEVNLTGLLPNTPYLFYVASADTDGNQAIDKNIPDTGPLAGETLYFTFTTDHDVTPPTLANTPFCQPVVTDNTGQPGLVITSRTTEPAIFSLSYGTTSGVWDGQLASTTDLDYNQAARIDNLLASTTYFFQYQLFDASLNATTSEIYNCNTLEPMVAKSVADALEAQLIGKVPEDEVGQRLASSSAIMFDETVPNDPNDATSTLWVQLARQGWMSIAKATAWVLASSTEALVGMVREDTIMDRIASTSDELKLSNSASSTDATSTEWVKRSREAWVPEAQKEQHAGQVYTQADLDAAKAAGKSEGQASSGGGGMLIIDKTDKVAPVISKIAVTEITAGSAKISWQTSEPANGFVRYGTSTESFENAGFYGLFSEHWFYARNLVPGSKYIYQVASADGSGNLTTSAELSFSTVETDAAVGSSTDFGMGSTSVSENLSPEVVQSAADKMMEIFANFSKVVSLNVFENSLVNQYDSIKKLAMILPAPILSGEPSIEVTPTTATIRWITDKKANSLVAFVPDSLYAASKKDHAYTQVVGQAQEKTSNHAVKIYNLKPDTVYHYQIRSQADLGPEAVSRDFVFRSKPESLEIINYTTDIESTEKATFKWLTSAVTDSELKVIPYHGTTLAIDEAKTVTDNHTATNHEITYREFTAGVVYQITLSGKDAKGAKIEKVITSFSTTKDDLPPEISNIQTESALSQSKESRVQTIITWETNEPTISQINYAKGVHENEDNLLEATPIETAYSKKHTIVITKFAVGEVYSFRVLATDSGGNQSLSRPHIVLTPKQREGVFELIIKTFESTFGWLGQMR